MELPKLHKDAALREPIHTTEPCTETPMAKEADPAEDRDFPKNDCPRTLVSDPVVSGPLREQELARFAVFLRRSESPSAHLLDTEVVDPQSTEEATERSPFILVSDCTDIVAIFAPESQLAGPHRLVAA
jgi:hypothetical protein